MDFLTMAIMAANPVAGVAYMQYKQGQNAVDDQRKAAEKAERQAVNNQNALVQQTYNQRRSFAQGIGENNAASPMGNAASQTGAVLDGAVQTSLLG